MVRSKVVLLLLEVKTDWPSLLGMFKGCFVAAEGVRELADALVCWREDQAADREEENA